MIFGLHSRISFLFLTVTRPFVTFVALPQIYIYIYVNVALTFYIVRQITINKKATEKYLGTIVWSVQSRESEGTCAGASGTHYIMIKAINEFPAWEITFLSTEWKWSRKTVQVYALIRWHRAGAEIKENILLNNIMWKCYDILHVNHHSHMQSPHIMKRRVPSTPSSLRLEFHCSVIFGD